MSRSFKIVGRYKDNENYSFRAKVGQQAKKRVYISLANFEKYAPETASRWVKYCRYDVEAYELIEDKWVEIEGWINKQGVLSE